MSEKQTPFTVSHSVVANSTYNTIFKNAFIVLPWPLCQVLHVYEFTGIV